MHISEGVLSLPVLGAGYAVTGAATWYSLRTLDAARLTTTAMLAAVFFVGSLVHIPLGPGNVHLLLGGLLGLFLGWAVFPALLVALLLQAILFRFGGLAVLGVNTCIIALPALVSAYVFRPLLDKVPPLGAVGAFCSGALSVAGAALCTALVLGISDAQLWTSAKILFWAHLPVMILEGVITALAVTFIARTKPETLTFSL